MTTWPGWAARHIAASRALVAVLLTVVALTTAILAGSLGNSGLLATRAAQEAFNHPGSGDAGLQIQTRLAADRAGQDELARSTLAAAFAPVAVATSTTLVSEPLNLGGGRLSLYSGDRYTPEHLDVVEGVWPAGPAEAALQADAAGPLGLAVGSTVNLAGQPVTVTALWRAKAPDSPGWLGDPLVVAGTDGRGFGPLVVEAALVEASGSPYIRWVSLPEVASITPRELAGLAGHAEAAAKAVKVADLTGRGLVVTGDLGPTAEKAARDAASGDAFGFVPVSVLVLIALVGLSQVAGLLAGARERQVWLLFARGAGLRQVLGGSLLESTAIALVGSGLGTGLAVLVLWFAAGDLSQARTVGIGGLAGFLLATAALGLVAVRATLAGARGHQPPSDRVRGVAGAALLVLAAVLAAVATWQLRRGSSFVTLDDEGAVHLDLISALAPALLLAMAAVVALALLAPITRLLELLARSSTSTGLWLASSQVARGLRLHAVAVVLTVLATGTATFAAMFAGTSGAISDGVAAVTQAAPLRAKLADDGRATPEVSGIAGVTATLPVWQGNAQVGDRLVPLVAAPVRLTGDVITLPPTVSLPPASALITEPTVAAAPIPDGGDSLTVTLGLRLGLDPWQSLYLATVPEEADRLAALNPGWTAETYVEEKLADYRKPVEVTARLLIRDAASGQSTLLDLGQSVRLTPSELTHRPGTPLTFPELSDQVVVELPLPAAMAPAIAGVEVQLTDDAYVARHLSASLSVTAGGTPLLGAATANWTSNLGVTRLGPYREAEAANPPRVTIEEVESENQTLTFTDINTPPQPGVSLQLAEPTWRIETHAPNAEIGSGTTRAINIGPGVAFSGTGDPLGTMQEEAATGTGRVPAAITPATAAAASLGIGDNLELGAFGVRIPTRIAAITPVVPTVAGAEGIWMDSATLSRVLFERSSSLGGPSELWIGFTGDPLAARAAVAELDGVESVTVAAGRAGGSAQVAANALWVAAACAMALAVAGLAASAATTLGTRRSEVAVLRAIGMTPRAQARSRAWESGAVLALATGLGVAGGWATSLAVVRPVALSATQASPSFTVPLGFDAAPWALLLLLGGAAAAGIVAAQARLVHRQALDPNYREEVR